MAFNCHTMFENEDNLCVQLVSKILEFFGNVPLKNYTLWQWVIKRLQGHMTVWGLKYCHKSPFYDV